MAPIMRLAVATCLTLRSLVSAVDTVVPLVCRTGVQIIAVVGANVTNGTQSYGFTATFVQKTLDAIPGSSSISLNYNRFPEGNETVGQTFIRGVKQGVPELFEALNNYTTACPNTPVVLHGYSQGAVVVGNLLCGASSGSFPVTDPLDSSYADNIVGVILYGDETRTAGQPYNEGTCTANAKNLPRRNPAGCNAFAPTIQSYCADNDIECCSTANSSKASWPGGYNPHHLYPQTSDDLAVAWVVEGYNNYTSRASASTATPFTTTTLRSTLSSSTSSTTPAPVTTTSASSSVTPVTTPSTTSTTPTTTSPSSVTSVTSVTSTRITTTTSKRTLSLVSAATCTQNKCVTSFAEHPVKATSVCSRLARGVSVSLPYPVVCASSAGRDFSARVQSVCGCLGFPTRTAVASTTTA